MNRPEIAIHTRIQKTATQIRQETRKCTPYTIGKRELFVLHIHLHEVQCSPSTELSIVSGEYTFYSYSIFCTSLSSSVLP